MTLDHAFKIFTRYFINEKTVARIELKDACKVIAKYLRLAKKEIK
jgi:hypothetical protein